jgi:hypothetical protein
MANARIIDHIERLREKPEHVRHQIAMGAAFGITGLVALGWMTAMATSGTLALVPDTVAVQGEGSGESLSEAIAEPASALTNLMGAAGAAFGATSTEAALSIIESETRTSSTLDAKAPSDKTVIPF